MCARARVCVGACMCVCACELVSLGRNASSHLNLRPWLSVHLLSIHCSMDMERRCSLLTSSQWRHLPHTFRVTAKLLCCSRMAWHGHAAHYACSVGVGFPFCILCLHACVLFPGSLLPCGLSLPPRPSSFPPLLPTSVPSLSTDCWRVREAA